jgi:hypothetical protein
MQYALLEPSKLCKRYKKERDEKIERAETEDEHEYRATKQ